MRNDNSSATPQRGTLYTCQELADLMETPTSEAKTDAVAIAAVVRFDPLPSDQSETR